ncbi:MAG TPA: hypothetical protein VFB62_06720, partial [Polyangiaceae bacterium]|nr:hypothetical protein [Polyangiaceae bacterium]
MARLSVGALCLLFGACVDNGVGSDSGFATEGVVCQNPAAYPNSVLDASLKNVPGALDGDGHAILTNFTAWPVYDPGSPTAAMDSAVTAPRTDPQEARDNIASRFGSECQARVNDHLREAKPNVYIYFTGFGGADQNNSEIDEAAILRWINERDPGGLIFSINWNCAASEDSWCKENTQRLTVSQEAPEYRAMTTALQTLVPQAAPQLLQVIAGMAQQQQGYDSALSHSMWLAARLIDQLLVADQGARIGDISILGYSMGAHAAAQLLVQDFTSDDSKGYKWTKPQCPNGAAVCTVAELKKVKWSLAMGLSGWSHALQRYNDFDAQGVPHRAAAERAQYENGGLFRVRDPLYRDKLNVLNRRMDPTGNSDDTFQRGFNDILFGDYNHYSHDYSLPLFIQPGFRRVLDAFLEGDDVEDLPEIGIVYDSGGLVDFDDCPAEGKCSASTNYLAHKVNRSHQNLGIPVTPKIATVDGVPHRDRSKNRAVSFTDSESAVAIRTFDQEDLRGGVEFYYRPRFDLASSGVRGLFSYGSCSGSSDDLMPEAYVEDGRLVFGMSYQGTRYEVEVEASQLARDKWAHLAFTWELPVEAITHPASAEGLQTYQAALAMAAGLRKPLPTTYKRQKGQGSLRIYVNAELAAEAPLGTSTSTRACRKASEVLSTESYQVGSATYPPYMPYARYDQQLGDMVALGQNQVIGSKCKAYRVRNTTANFGCARSEEISATGDMDDILIVYGPGRTDYANVGHGTGEPINWPLGVEYDAT